MTRLLLIVALLGVAWQQPDESLPATERRIPAGDYCKRADVAITKKETHAHHCACVYTCHVDAQGNVVEAESPDCLAYCHKNGRRCTCHVEEPCPEDQSRQIADHDSVLVPPRLADLHERSDVPFRGKPERNERINGRRYRLRQVGPTAWQAVKNPSEGYKASR